MPAWATVRGNALWSPSGSRRVSGSPDRQGLTRIKDRGKSASIRLIPGMVLPVPPGALEPLVRPHPGTGWSDSQINARPTSIALPRHRSQSHVSQRAPNASRTRHAARPVQTFPPHVCVWPPDSPRAPRLRIGGHRCGPRGARPRGLPVAGARPRCPISRRTSSRTVAEVGAGPTTCRAVPLPWRACKLWYAKEPSLDRRRGAACAS